ncbi:MAG UNVERIFIED_CONTAM: T4 RnlA family RNA ligase [Thermobifida fusca]
MHINDIIPAHELAEAMANKLIRAQHHDDLPLVILNYTYKAQINSVWNRATMNARGLIYNAVTGQVVARPFRKFFNYNEEPEDRRRWSEDEMVVINDKLDGSLGILYPTGDGDYAIATRGSFTSAQALHATEVFKEKYADRFVPREGYTYLFEIIYPDNRIVVDYGDMDDLVLIGVVENGSGLTFSPTGEAFGQHWRWPGPIVETSPYKRFRDALAAPPRPNREGLVVHFLDSDERVKIKQRDYIRLHKTVTGLDEKAVWEHMRQGKTLSALLEQLPDELHEWARMVWDDLEYSFFLLDETVAETFDVLYDAGLVNDRKTFALAIKDKPNWLKAALFRMLDGRDYADVILKNLEPVGGEK